MRNEKEVRGTLRVKVGTGGRRGGFLPVPLTPDESLTGIETGDLSTVTVDTLSEGLRVLSSLVVGLLDSNWSHLPPGTPQGRQDVFLFSLNPVRP